MQNRRRVLIGRPRDFFFFFKGVKVTKHFITGDEINFDKNTNSPLVSKSVCVCVLTDQAGSTEESV